MDFFSTQNIAFTLWDYSMSFTELIATLLGIWATILSARRITYTWLVNLGAVAMFSLISYQLRLYSDLILQVFYFVMGILGWLWWNKKAVNHHVQVGYWSPGAWGYALFVVVLALATVLAGYLTSHFYIWMPQWFKEAAMPYQNASILVMSIAGTVLMGRRRIENWWLWAVSNPFAAWIYYQQGSVLVCCVYLVFWVIGLTGWYNWQKEYKQHKTATV